MENLYKTLRRKEIKRENEIIYYLSCVLQIKEVRKLFGKRYGAWYEQECLGSIRGYECILRDENRLFIDVKKDGEYITLTKLFVKEKGKGVGSAIMQALRAYTDENGGVLSII
jgi:hypothetical protein